MSAKYLTPQSIAEITGGEYIGDEHARKTRVTGAVRDNRDVSPGNLFVCIQGERADGHAFANSAYRSGAACCLAEHLIPGAEGPYVLVKSTLSALMTLAAHYRARFAIPIVGVTGSVGKTSAKEMTAAVLGEKYNVLKTQENLNNEIGVPLTLLSLNETHEAAVIEMGISEFGEMSRLAQMVRPDICIMTNIGYSHLKELGDLNGVLRAKSEVFAYMSPGSVAVLNGDDELLRAFDPGVRKVTYGFGAGNDIRAENVRAEGTDAVLCDIVSEISWSGKFGAHSDTGMFNTPAGFNRAAELNKRSRPVDEGKFADTSKYHVRIPAYGSHLPMAALAAAATGSLLGMTDYEISRGILLYTPVDGRANVVDTGFVTLIDDCYNANPNSVRAALESLSALPGRHIAILGDMLNLGVLSDELHREIGEFAARSGVDTLLCSGANAAFIFDGFAGESSAHFSSNAELIAALPALLRQGDRVLVKASHSMMFAEIAAHISGMK